MKRILFRVFVLFSIIATPVFVFTNLLLAENIDPYDDGSQYAWGENVGWINFEPSQGPGVTVSDTNLTGTAWGENIGWINLSPSTSGGVTNDGNGNLAGWAWSENAGWISFSCLNTASCATTYYEVTIDPVTGEFGGYAWGENIGWINFAPNGVPVKTSWMGVDCIDNEDCDNGLYCDGAEYCDAGYCQSGMNPCPDDGLWCNGAEGCNEATDQCTSTGNTCHDDGLWCNGTEGCDEQNDQCTSTADPCPDDGQWCNGTEGCDEQSDQCTPGTDPCADDGLWCNGTEGCDEAGDQCISTGNPCPSDDGLWCNGTEACDDIDDRCVTRDIPDCNDYVPCTEDSCNEGTDSYDHAPDHAACDDGDGCTSDVCSLTSGCTHAIGKDTDNDSYLDRNCLGGTDCNDSDEAVNPGTMEEAFGDPVCSDTVDNDCDGATDGADTGCLECLGPSDCNDGNPCTDDDCVGGNCVNTKNTDPCNDGNSCTEEDTCSGGACTGSPLDLDNDGFVSKACGGNDCNDSNAQVRPSAMEGPFGDSTCSDGLDNDCDSGQDALDPSCADSSTWYVDGSVQGPGTGLQTDPFRTIQAALDVSNTGDRIEVADGTYLENLSWPEVYDITLVSAGGEPTSCRIEAADPGQPVLSGSFVTDVRLTVEGVTLTGGTEGIALTFNIPALAEEVKIINNYIEGNTNYGVKISSILGGSAIVSENRILSNGTGVELDRLGVVFTGNAVVGNTLQGVVIRGKSEAVARVNVNEVYDNGKDAPETTHGIWISGSGSSYYDEVEVRDNEVYENLTDYGVRLEVADTVLKVLSNRIHTHTQAHTEAGLYVRRLGGSVLALEVNNNRLYGNSQAEGLRIVDEGTGLATVSVGNNLVYGNQTGVRLVRGNDTAADVRNNTVVENTGGGFVLETSGTGNVDLVNTILWANGDDLTVDDSTNTLLRYSDVEDTGGENEGDQVLHLDPEFTGEDYELGPASPCLGTGEDGADMGYTGGEQGNNTFEGQTDPVQVEVEPTGAAQVTFTKVNGSGRTWAFAGAYCSGVPKSFKVSDAPKFVDVNTDAHYTSPVEVCLEYELSWFTGIPGFDETKIKLLHKPGRGTVFAALLSVVDTVAKRVCGDVTTGLSPFVVAYPVGCLDLDEDGYGDPGDPSCSGGSQTDCDDADSAVYPGAPEIECNQIDEDCNGSDNCPGSCAGNEAIQPKQIP